MNHRFDRKEPGDDLYAEEMNEVFDAVARMDATSVGEDGVTTGTFSARLRDDTRNFVLARMMTEFVDVEAWMDQNPDGVVPRLYNAIELTWDRASASWVDVPGGEFDADFPYQQGIDQNQPVVCVRIDDRWVGLAQNPVRLAVTSRTPPGDSSGIGPSGSGGTDGLPWYPDEADDPTVYPITFCTLPYPNLPARWTATPSPEDPDPDTGVVLSEMSVPTGPHATVLNLDDTPGNYLPEGTTVACFQVGGRWFTNTTIRPPQAIFPARLVSSADHSTFTAGVSSGSAVLTGIADTSWYEVGDEVTGIGIPSGAVILAIPSATTMKLTGSATASSVADLKVVGAPVRYAWVEQQAGRDGIYEDVYLGRSGSRAICVGNPTPQPPSGSTVWMRPFFEADDDPFAVTGSTSASGSAVTGVSPDTDGVRVGYSVTGPGFPDGTTVTAISGTTLDTEDAADDSAGSGTFTITPRPRRVLNYDFLWFAGSGSPGGSLGPGSGYCALAGLQNTDCVTAASDDGYVGLGYAGGGSWTSSTPLAYPGGSGIARFWFFGGEWHFSIEVSSGSGPAVAKELQNCHDGCFTGGPVTGHVPEPSGSGGGGCCAGETFSVCVSCGLFIDGHVSSGAPSCCPGVPIPRTLYLTLPAGPFAGTYPMFYDALNRWWVVYDIGCKGTRFNFDCGLAGFDPATYQIVGELTEQVTPSHAFTGYNGGDFVSCKPLIISYTAWECDGAGPSHNIQDDNSAYMCGVDMTTLSAGGLVATVSELKPPGPLGPISSGSGPPWGCCGLGTPSACGGSSSATLTATATAKVGCVTDMPSSFTMNCVSAPGSTSANWQTTGTITACGSSYTASVNDDGTGTPTLSFLGITTIASPGSTFSPFSAVFHVNDGSGNTVTITVAG